MNFNILKNVPSAKFALFAPARVRNGAIATAIILLLVFAGSAAAKGNNLGDMSDLSNAYNTIGKNNKANQTSTQGTKEWNAGALQVNNLLSQMRQQAQGVAGAMQYVNQAEKLWKQAQAQWAMQQGYQQQNAANQMRIQLLAQQQNLMNQLNKQQQFLQQQLAYLNTPLKKKMDEDSLQHFGRVLQPDINAKRGPGLEAWTEAMRQLDSISSASSSVSTRHPAVSKTPKDNGGSYDNPLAKNAASNSYANDPNVVDLTGSKTLTPKLLRESDSEKYGRPLNEEESRLDPYSSMSDERLERKREALTKAISETQKLSENNVRGYSQVEADATAGKNNAYDKLQDAVIAGSFGIMTNISEKNDMRKLFKAVNMEPGPDKINAMRESSKAIKLDNDIGYASTFVDASSATDSLNKGNFWEAGGQTAVIILGTKIKSSTSSSIGTLQLISDTGYVLLDASKRSEEYERQEQLRNQLAANSLKLSNQLKKLIEEQNRRKSALTSDKPEPKVASPPTQQSITHDEFEFGRREIPMDPKWIIKEGSGPSQ